MASQSTENRNGLLSSQAEAGEFVTLRVNERHHSVAIAALHGLPVVNPIRTRVLHVAEEHCSTT
jgi:hypothetical protein